jgi:hypothetical protein
MHYVIQVQINAESRVALLNVNRTSSVLKTKMEIKHALTVQILKTPLEVHVLEYQIFSTIFPRPLETSTLRI